METAAQEEERSDVDRMLGMFSALGLGQSDSMQVVTIPGAPWSKSRPRFAKSGHAYSKAEDQDAEFRTATYLRRVVRQPYTGNVGLVCLFFRPNRQRIDTDNLLKHVCDAGNGVLWIDDSQCTALMGITELDRENPRTVVAIGTHDSTLKRGSDDNTFCALCGEPIPRGSSGHPRRTCSRNCRQLSLGLSDLAELVPCDQCGKRFRRKVRTQKFCTTQCRTNSLRDKAKAAAGPLSRCVDCKVELKHRRGGRCRRCWRADMKERSEVGGAGLLGLLEPKGAVTEMELPMEVEA